MKGGDKKERSFTFPTYFSHPRPHCTRVNGTRLKPLT